MNNNILHNIISIKIHLRIDIHNEENSAIIDDLIKKYTNSERKNVFG